MTNWIPVSERLPTREDADDSWYVLWAHRDGAVGVWLWDARETTAAAWAPVPPYTPPKPGPTNTECANILHYSALACMNHLDPKDDVPLEEQFAMVRRWFADVTARIEKEEGT